LEYFSDDYPLRNWDQFLRHYETFTKIRGSYLWAAQLTDPELIAEMVALPEKEWSSGSGPPPLFGWNDLLDKLTDVCDQLIASRAQDDKVKFMPRPVVPAVKLRKLRKQDHQYDRVEEARRKNLMRRQAANGT
jgi:hypothetical protein